MKRLGGLLLLTVAATAAIIAAADPQTSARTRVLVWDEAGGVLHAIDAESGTRLASARVPAGSLFASHDTSRMVAFWVESRTRIEHATVLDRRSLAILGDVPLGIVCTDRVQTPDGRYLAILCFDPRSRSTDTDQELLLGIDLSTGRLTGRLPLVGDTSLLSAGQQRVAVISRRTHSSPSNTILVAALPEMKEPARLDLPCAGAVRRELHDVARQRVVVRCDDERPHRKNVPVAPSSMMIVDLGTLAAPRVVPLGESAQGAWSFTDGRYIYVDASAAGRGEAEPALIVFSVDEERVSDRIALAPEASWIQSWPQRVGWRPDEGPFLIQSASKLLVIDHGRLLAAAELPGRSVHSMLTRSADRRRLYVTRDRTVVAVDRATGRPEWTTTLPKEGGVTVSPDGNRLLGRRGDDIALLDPATGATLGQFKASTRGGRTGLFWKDLGLSFVSGALGGGYVNSALSTDVAFSETARRAMVLATTGEVALVDLADGRLIARLPDRASAVVGLPAGALAILLSPRKATVFDMVTAKEIGALTFADAPGGVAPRVAFSRDGALVAVGAGSTVQLMDAVTGRLVARADGLGRIAQVVFLD